MRTKHGDDGTEVGLVSEQPLWQDVAATLRSQIKQGDYPPGKSLPSEIDLSERFEVSRDTVRRALNKLTQEGLLTAGRTRRGRQVRRSKALTFYAVRSESDQRTAQRRISNADAWVTDAAEQNRKAGQEISVSMVEAEPEVTSRLKVPDSTIVVVRRRLRTIDGEPHNLNDTYYPLDIAEGTPIMQPADVAQGTIALMRELGHVQVRYRDDLETRMPTPDEADRLLIPPGVPVLVQYRTGYTAERPVKLTITIWPGDRTLLVYEFPS